MQSATLYCANKRVTYKAIWNNTQHIPRHKRPANPKRTTSRFYQGRSSLNHTTELALKTTNLPLLPTQRGKNETYYENVEINEQPHGLVGILTNAKKEIISSIPTRRSNKLLTSPDDRESVLSPEAMVLVQEARNKAGRKNSMLSSQEMIIPNITSTGKISERYPQLLPSSVASHTSNISPNPRNGVESVAGFTESGIQSIEQLRPFHQIAGKTLSSIPQNQSIFPTVGRIDSVIQEQTKVKKGKLSQKQSPRLSTQKRVPRLVYNQMSSQLLDTIFPPLRDAHQSSARLSKVLENFSIKRPDIETVRLWQQQNELAKKKAEKQKSNQAKRNNDFNCKLKAKYKKMVVRKKGELVQFGSIKSSPQRVDSLYQTTYAISSYKPLNLYDKQKTRQLKEEHHSMLKEMVDKPFNEEDAFNQTGESLNPLNKTSPIHMNIQHAGLLQSGQSFWGGGHPSGRRKNPARSPSASPTFGGGDLLHQESQEIEGTFRERISPNPHLDEVQKLVAVGLRGKRFSQVLNSPSLAQVPVAEEEQLGEKDRDDDEMIQNFKQNQRKSVVVLNNVPPEVQLKKYPGSLRESHQSISGISATTRGILSRPSPMPQNKIPCASTHTSGENQNLLPPLNHQMQPDLKKKLHLVQSAQLPPPQTTADQFQKKSHFSKDSYIKDQTPSRRDKQPKSVPIKKKLRPIKPRKSIDVSTKSICKHITLEIPIPQQHQRGLLPRQAGGASTVSMAPLTQSPLLATGKINALGHGPIIKPGIMGKNTTNITPTLYQQSQGVQINQRIDSPYTHNFEAQRNHLLINDSTEVPRSIYSRKETTNKRDHQSQPLHQTPTPAYNHANFEVRMGDEPGEAGEMGEVHQFLNEFSDEMMEREQHEIIKEEENSPLIHNIRLMNQHVTQKVKSAFKTNL